MPGAGEVAIAGSSCAMPRYKVAPDTSLVSVCASRARCLRGAAEERGAGKHRVQRRLHGEGSGGSSSGEGAGVPGFPAAGPGGVGGVRPGGAQLRGALGGGASLLSSGSLVFVQVVSCRLLGAFREHDAAIKDTWRRSAAP